MSQRKNSRIGARRPLTDKRSTEALSAKIQELLSSQNFASLEEANAFMAENIAGMCLDDVELEPKSPLEEAQAIVWKAFEAPSKKKRIALAKEALKISDDCADAYVLLAEMTDSGSEMISYYRQGVEAGKRAISELLEKDPASFPFWQMLETRPYMRALAGLASALHASGDVEESMALWKELLRLNPNDNQGARYILAPLLLEHNRLDEAEVIIEKYKTDIGASMLYSRALFLFKKQGDSKDACVALRKAIKRNKYVMEFLLGMRRFSNTSGPVAIGSPEEAEEYVLVGAASWVKDPASVEWTADLLAREPELMPSRGGANVTHMSRYR
ncbi:hypothetical protein KA183_13035 [bacterium]|nr:hypothetical protein [bacterium]QQR57754.1 MAG: hypothetical protein IPG59_22745 [Candidatus Melainabacteria bacterium]